MIFNFAFRPTAAGGPLEILAAKPTFGGRSPTTLRAGGLGGAAVQRKEALAANLPIHVSYDANDGDWAKGLGR